MLERARFGARPGPWQWGLATERLALPLLSAPTLLPGGVWGLSGPQAAQSAE